MGLIEVDSFPRQQVVRVRTNQSLQSPAFFLTNVPPWTVFLFLLLRWVVMQQGNPCQDASAMVFQGPNNPLYKLPGLRHLLIIIQSTLIDMVIAKFK